MELISVHIPKTAGVTFRNVLRGVYGGAGVAFDYDDRPLDPRSTCRSDPDAWRAASTAFLTALPPTTRVVHGHFCVGKYAGQFPEARRIVWLREPVARLVSHYHYWRDLPPTPHPLHRRLLDEQLSLLEFARLAPMRNVVAEIFLRGVSLDDFAFVGVQECFAADLARLAKLLSWPPIPSVGEENRNPSPDYQVSILGEAEREEIAALNAVDVHLYRQAAAGSSTW